jgi:hypothetical protein
MAKKALEQEQDIEIYNDFPNPIQLSNSQNESKPLYNCC